MAVTPRAVSPVTIDAATRATPYHAMAKPVAPAPRTRRSAKLAIPRIPPPPAPDSQGRVRGNRVAKPKPPGKPKPKPPLMFQPPVQEAPPTQAYPSYGDPLLDARRRGIQAATDIAAKAASDYATQGTARLGELAQLAGMSSVNPATSGLTGAAAALPGVMAQDAQQAALKQSALAVDSANRVPSYIQAQGLQNLQAFDADVRASQMKAREDQLNLLKSIYQSAVSAGNAQLAANARLAATQLQQAGANDRAATAQAGTDARTAAAGAAAAGKAAKTAASKYATLKNQWTARAHWDPKSESFGGGTMLDNTPGSPTFGLQIPKPGEDPIAFMSRAATAGVKPMDAVRIALAAGAPMFAQPAGAGHVLTFLRKYLGLKRGAAAYNQLVREAHLTPTTGYMIQGPPAP